MCVKSSAARRAARARPLHRNMFNIRFGFTCRSGSGNLFGLRPSSAQGN